ncbi:ABC transporter permease subunit [bacterium]|nr:ABC transporter permease subunit [bacterium]
MRLRDVLTIYRKDLLETLRDRRTLLFVLAVPALSICLISLGASRLVGAFVKEVAMRDIVVVATPETRAAYEELAHRAFLETKVGKTLERLANPILGAILPSPIQGLKLPDDMGAVVSQPAAYAEWARGLASQMRERAGEAVSRPSRANIAVPESFRGAGEDFFIQTVRGIGMVKWMTPAEVEVDERITSDSLSLALKELPDAKRIQSALDNRRIDVWMSIQMPKGPIDAKPWKTAQVSLYYDATQPTAQEAASRLRRTLDAASTAIVAERLRSLRQPSHLADPINVDVPAALSNPKNAMRSMIGGMVPYFIILFAYIGAMFPAIDLGAGEKERNTLETLLLAPVGRLEIALGKFLVVVTTSMTSALVGVCTAALMAAAILPPEVREMTSLKPSLEGLLAVVALAFPLACTFAGVFLGTALFARSFKEAQNYLSPLGVVLTLPPAYALLPWSELNGRTALIPMVNTALIARDYLVGNFHAGYYFMAMGSSLTVAAAALAFCTWQFHRESVLFRS